MPVIDGARTLRRTVQKKRMQSAGLIVHAHVLSFQDHPMVVHVLLYQNSANL